MTGRRWTDEDIAAVCQAVEDGKTQKVIAFEFGTSDTSIRKLLERQRNRSSPEKQKWTDDKVTEARRLADSGWNRGQLAVHFGVSYNSIQKLLWRSLRKGPDVPPARVYARQPLGWVLGSGRGKHPLADPLLAALFKHHRARAPESLIRRLLPAPVGLITHLCMLRRPKPKPKPVILTPPSPLLPPRKYPSLRSIMERVLIANDLSETEFMARTRAGLCVEARAQFFVLAAQETINSLVEIGRFVDRDHSTVLHSITRYCERHNIPRPRGHVLCRSLRSRMAAKRSAEARACA